MEYKEPIFEIVLFGTDDVIRTSGEEDGNARAVSTNNGEPMPTPQ